jgi:ribose transport system ATP-binding protein
MGKHESAAGQLPGGDRSSGGVPGPEPSGSAANPSKAELETTGVEPFLTMQGVSKRFPGVLALDSVDFDVRPGEVHALMGENGAGKSTLMKILSGVYHLDKGEVRLAGKPVNIGDPRAAQRHGIAIIHQELNQVPELRAFENFFLGRERHSRLGIVNERTMRKETAQWLGRLGLELDPNRKLRELRVAERQLLEIGKAMSLQAQIMVMDEPTTALNAEEVAQLFEVVRRLRANGMGIVYISHRIDEIFRISDRVTVLRDGKLVGTKPVGEVTRDSLIKMMVGRELRDMYPTSRRERGRTVLEVEGLSVTGVPGRRALQEVAVSVRAGEIVGLGGLLGSGRTELLETIFGVPNPSRVSGTIRLGGESRRFPSPRKAIRAGVSFVTEDRKGQSLVLVRSVGENTSLAALHRLRFGPWLRLREEARQIRAMIKELRIKTPGLQTPAASLSGGNQQKVALAKFLLLDTRLLLLDEPTQGIDVGAKAEIYALIDGLAQRGVAVVVASSDMPELLALCDRIYVMCEGRVSGEVSKEAATQERILDYATRFTHLPHFHDSQAAPAGASAANGKGTHP